MDILEAISTRRSLSKMQPDAPPRHLIEQVLQAGVHAANHYDTQPWRFYVLSGDERAAFGEVLAESLANRMRDADETQREALMKGERAKPLRSPVLVVVGVQSEAEDEMTRREDLQAASAALQNMLLAATSLDLAAIWRTGDGAYDDGVKAYFGLRPQDEIAGILYLGYADATFGPAPARERDFAAKTEWRGSLS